MGGETLIGSPANPEYDTWSSVARLAGGGYVVIWSNWLPGSGQFQAYAQMVSADGPLAGPQVDLDASASSIATYSSVLGPPDGGYVVVWSQDNPGSSRELVISRFDAGGALIEGEVLVSQNGPTIQHAPGITLLDDGGFLVSWSAPNPDDNSGGMFARRYDADGVAQSDEVLINQTLAGQQHPVTNAGNRGLTPLEDGRVVSVRGTDHGAGELCARLIDIPTTGDATEGEPLDPGLAAALADGSETLTITFSGFPAGSSFNLGAADGAVRVINQAETADLAALGMTTPDEFDGPVTLTATARATETSNGDFAETAASVDLVIAAANRPPLLSEGDDQINFGNPGGRRLRPRRGGQLRGRQPICGARRGRRCLSATHPGTHPGRCGPGRLRPDPELRSRRGRRCPVREPAGRRYRGRRRARLDHGSRRQRHDFGRGGGDVIQCGAGDDILTGNAEVNDITGAASDFVHDAGAGTLLHATEGYRAIFGDPATRPDMVSFDGSKIGFCAGGSLSRTAARSRFRLSISSLRAPLAAIAWFRSARPIRSPFPASVSAKTSRWSE